MPQLLLFIFLFSLSIKLCFALYYYLRLALYRVPSYKDRGKTDSGGISLIVCYHNEESNVIASLKSLTNQSYKNLELVLVDDMSTDNTKDLLREHRSTQSVLIENDTAHNGKKQALTKGIISATKDWLLLTDADCLAPNEWATTMASYTTDHDIVLGYAPLHKSKTIVGKFARFETYYTALQYLSFSLAGQPYMGVGRNLMYHRSIFEKSDGFTSHTDIASGDDDLLVNYAANASNTTICIDPNAFVYSPGKETFTSFIRQKTRHVSSSHRYRWIDKVLLGLSSITHIGLYISAIILLFSQHSYWVIALMIYWLLMIIIQYPICKKLHSMDLWLLYPVYDFALALYYVIMIPFTFIKKQNSWS